MKATLIKTDKDNYILVDSTKGVYDKGYLIGSSRESEVLKLSKQNCDEIFGIYSPSELSKVLVEGERGAFEFGYCLAREHNRDKVFTLEQVHKLLRLVHTLPNRELEVYEDENNQLKIDDFISHNISQPTEIEVGIEMETINEGLDEKAQPQYANHPKLDGNGCMILRKI
jgi:hypothetical protein